MNNPAATYEDMMGALVQNLEQTNDPYKKMLGQMILQNFQSERQSDQGTKAPRPRANGQMQQDVKTLVKINRGLLGEYKALRQSHDELKQANGYTAAALGACECWGFDASCANCGGQGAPGNFEVDEPKFNRLIQPLFEKIFAMMSEADNQNHQ
jgi:hypothetical protein